MSISVSSSMTKVTLEYSENTTKFPEKPTPKPKQHSVSIGTIRHLVMPTKTIAKCKPTTNSWAGIKTQQCTVTKKSTDNLIWYVPQKEKNGQVLNTKYCSDQTERNRLGRNGQEVSPLSVGVLRVHFTLDSTLSKQKRKLITSKIQTPVNQDTKIVINEECLSVLRPRFFEDYSYYLINNGFEKPYP